MQHPRQHQSWSHAVSLLLMYVVDVSVGVLGDVNTFKVINSSPRHVGTWTGGPGDLTIALLHEPQPQYKRQISSCQWAIDYCYDHRCNPPLQWDVSHPSFLCHPPCLSLNHSSSNSAAATFVLHSLPHFTLGAPSVHRQIQTVESAHSSHALNVSQY